MTIHDTCNATLLRSAREPSDPLRRNPINILESKSKISLSVVKSTLLLSDISEFLPIKSFVITLAPVALAIACLILKLSFQSRCTPNFECVFHS